MIVNNSIKRNKENINFLSPQFIKITTFTEGNLGSTTNSDAAVLNWLMGSQPSIDN